MEAKDTAMDDIALLAVNKELPLKGGSRWQGVKLRKYRSLVQAQAEITAPIFFKAGYEQCKKDLKSKAGW